MTPSIASSSDHLQPSDCFAPRHLGPRPEDQKAMLSALGVSSMGDLLFEAIPDAIRNDDPLRLRPAASESQATAALRKMMSKNRVLKSAIGAGYHNCLIPSVIERTVFRNPGWYTQYTPYQAEISQGRMEVLLAWQTMIADLCGLPLAGASLLDEPTAAAEAMAMARNIARGKGNVFLIDADAHPQTIAVVLGRAAPMGIEVRVVSPDTFEFGEDVFGCLVQMPNTNGKLQDHAAVAEAARSAGSVPIAAVDPLLLTLMRSPGEMGFEIAVGSAQRFGVPMGFGGPHAGFLATQSNHVRRMPGRIIGVSRDAEGRPALRLTVQTREQHIRRDKATSNICTSQVLLAVMSGFYGIWHGPEGLTEIAKRVRELANLAAESLEAAGFAVEAGPRFDTVAFRSDHVENTLTQAQEAGWNLRDFGDGRVGLTVDETFTPQDLESILSALGCTLVPTQTLDWPAPLVRSSTFMSDAVFHAYRSETQMLRLIKRLESRDLSLCHSMIPLGSCTMKLNSASEMNPVSWPEFSAMHPFAPESQTEGWKEFLADLERSLAEVTGFAGVSLQPNAGAQGEYAGLMTIRAYHEARNESHRNICLVPTSAHGTNPASAVMAGMTVVPLQCDERGDLDVSDLDAKIAKHGDDLAALMVTYPSTHGVFEATIREVCDKVHAAGGQVYLDGANMNAMVGLAKPGDLGADVCHLNLHKTFCIPHGGGGPGMGPIGLAAHLLPYRPGHPVRMPDGADSSAIAPISGAPYGSASILAISWMYLEMMGPKGLREATELAILNANYMAARLSDHYSILYTSPAGRCAHEFILDCRDFEKTAGIRVEDIAKRLMDYGFPAPTMSWPVPGTLMIEPTESEDHAELDRYCDALIAIREEIREIESGEADRDVNLLKMAPHTQSMLVTESWDRPYARERAVYPLAYLRESKFWPPVARVDNPWGDRNIFCSCSGVEEVTNLVESAEA